MNAKIHDAKDSCKFSNDTKIEDLAKRDIDLTSMRFGHWLVSSQSRTINYHKQWLCRCDCGNERYVDEHNLRSGKSTSCGCHAVDKAHSNFKDLTGMKFGKLIVIKQAPNYNNRTAWLCQCECGNQKVVQSHLLLSGRTKSCGCSRRIKNLENHGIRDLRGYQSGYLQVLHETEKRNKNGSVIWHCRCSKCGREVDLTESELVSGNYVSCGCYKKEVNAKIGETLHFVDNTCVEWLENRKSRKDNTSGFRGVTKVNDHYYKVNIGFRKKRYYLGGFPTYEEAVRVRLSAEKELHVAFVNEFRKWNRIAQADPHWAEENPFVFHEPVAII